MKRGIVLVLSMGLSLLSAEELKNESKKLPANASRIIKIQEKSPSYISDIYQKHQNADASFYVEIFGFGTKKPSVSLEMVKSDGKSKKMLRGRIEKYDYDAATGSAQASVAFKKVPAGDGALIFKNGLVAAKSFLAIGTENSKKDSSADVSFSVNSDWGSGFVATVGLKNNGESKLDSWTLEFDFPYSITQIWNAEIVSSDGQHHKIKNISWNGSLAPGETTSFGFCGAPGNVISAPENVKFSGDCGETPDKLQAVNDSTSVVAGNSVEINLLANDIVPPGSQAAVTAIGIPSHGIARLSQDSLKAIYIHAEGYLGSDRFSYTIGDQDGQSSSAEVSVTVSSPPIIVPGTPSISILKDWEKGGYVVKWTKWSGAAGNLWRLFEDGVKIHEESISAAEVQSGELRIDEGKAYGVYGYQIELANSAGKALSEIKYYAVDGASHIVIAEADNGRQSLQTTVGCGETISLTLSNLLNASANFAVATNNPDAVDCAVGGNILSVKGRKPGRAGIRISDTGGGEVRHLGIRVKNEDGSLPGMPSYLAVGSVSEDSDGDLSFWRSFGEDAKNRRMDIRYIYINGGPKSMGGGWRTWTDRDGFRVTSFVRESIKLGMIPFLVYYNIPDGGESYYTDKEHIQSYDYMFGYFTDLKFALELAKNEAGDEMVGFLLEPDFLGYMAQNDASPDSILARTDAAYESGALVRGEDPSYPNTVAGLVQAINCAISRKMPSAYFGWQFNLWASPAGGFTTQIPGKGIVHLTDSGDIAAGREAVRKEALAISDYYISAGILSNGADFVSIDKYGLDAGAEGKNANPADSTWFWNAIHWRNYLEFASAMHAKTELPVILWQIPTGRINSSLALNPYSEDGKLPDLPNVSRRFEDSAPSYFFGDSFSVSGARFDYFSRNDGASAVSAEGRTVTWGRNLKVAKTAGVIAALFGAGVGDSTDGIGTPTSDDNWWISKAQDYYKNPVLLGPDDPEPNRAPIASDDNLNVEKGGSAMLNVLANDSDPDGDTLTAEISIHPAHGTANFANNILTYTSEASYEGSDSLVYTISDGRGETDSALVSIVVQSKPPVGDGTSVAFKVTGDWGSGFGGEIKINYGGKTTIDQWTLEFDFPYQITCIWNAEIASNSGGRYRICNVSWNGRLAPGASVSFGFNGSPGNVLVEPSNISFNGVPIGESENRAPDALDDFAETAYETGVTVNAPANDSDPD